ncbi:MAG TPA: beta-ketoacyl-ACP synthase III [Candidatus Solibacter sp.]|jgi:3-oxoacyl-[acyl-carrier-protein] synthase-3|nr:beta-ketoacyl-ACP synthase III [Candidatus Solibacter sp.]
MPEIGYRTAGRRAAILGLGGHVPEQRVSNAMLSEHLDTSDEWIRQRTGIAERRMAVTGATTSELALPAARQALERAEVLASELDLIVLGTSSPDRPFPAAACVLQRQLGAEGAMAFDVLAACSSWLYAASVAERYIATGGVRRALVVGSEVLSRILDYTDRGTCILFGDGAGAAVLGPSDEAGFDSWVIGADGRQSELIYCSPDEEDGLPRLRMDGRETFKSATRVMEEASLRACAIADVSPDELALVVPHQANLRIVEAVAKRLGIGLDRFSLNLDRYGNTSSASIPLALEEASSADRLHPGDRVLLVGFGSGLTWGASVLTWGT